MLSDDTYKLARAFADHAQVECEALGHCLHAGDADTLRSLMHHLKALLVQGEAVRACLYNQLQLELCDLNGPELVPQGLLAHPPPEPPPAPPAGLLGDLNKPKRQPPARLSDFPKLLDV